MRQRSMGISGSTIAETNRRAFGDGCSTTLWPRSIARHELCVDAPRDARFRETAPLVRAVPGQATRRSVLGARGAGFVGVGGDRARSDIGHRPQIEPGHRRTGLHAARVLQPPFFAQAGKEEAQVARVGCAPRGPPHAVAGQPGRFGRVATVLRVAGRVAIVAACDLNEVPTQSA